MKLKKNVKRVIILIFIIITIVVGAIIYFKYNDSLLYPS